MTALPFDLQVPIVGLLLTGGLWILLEFVARRFPPASLARSLLLRSKLSLCLTAAAASLSYWVVGLLRPSQLPLPINETDLRDTLISIGLIWTLVRCKTELFRKADRFSSQLFPALPTRDRLFLFDVADKLIGTVVFVLIGLAILKLLGAPLAVLATAGGFGAAAVGFGARTIVENVLSGISLYINRPFVVGDLIQIPSESLIGEVENIGWFYTQLRDLERQPIFMPNAIFVIKPVINTGGIDNRRVWIEFRLRYNDRGAVEAIIRDLQAVLEAEPDLDSKKPHVVHFVGYGASSLDLRVLCFCASSDIFATWDMQQRLLLQIGRLVEEHGAEMPFPTRTLLHA
ncbi:MAG: mechanosensitive ion channel [Cyanobacteria bacterium]|nr:mechanosensitive ion channel [Cyanobacteria bacterium bin.51]